MELSFVSCVCQLEGDLEELSYYYALQQEARRLTIDALNDKALKTGHVMTWDKVTLCSILGKDIGDACAFAATEWAAFRSLETHDSFSPDWEALAKKNFSDPDHFNLAVWQKIDGKQTLVALALGNPSRARKYLTIKWIERYFGYTPIAGRALLPILSCAEGYANLLGSERVLIKDPLDPNKYQRYGYKRFCHPNVAYGGNYLSKEV